MAVQDYLFVYGTLRRGFKHPLARRLAYQADFTGLGQFQGRLYDLGSYPGLIVSDQAEDRVVGDLYRLYRPDQILKILDKYEAHYPADPARSLYLRQCLPVEAEQGQTIWTWVYIYNRPVQGYRLIASGDYLHYLQAESVIQR